jgi:hypothetical protein
MKQAGDENRLKKDKDYYLFWWPELMALAFEHILPHGLPFSV